MLNVRHVTNNQPFFAGVILLEEGNLVATLNMDGLPSALMKNPAWRVGGVGGGQKAGETIWECALREAYEELCTEVTLRPSQVTYFHDIDTGKITSITCDDPIAPFLLERQSNLFPYGP
ncbi:MAG: NUDIX hydrolase, partial [Ktedonobacteraceae bacterium]|nr:NUDIX hydrolase [Ktedonobacteraceae bacterium]